MVDHSQVLIINHYTTLAKKEVTYEGVSYSAVYSKTLKTVLRISLIASLTLFYVAISFSIRISRSLGMGVFFLLQSIFNHIHLRGQHV